MKGLVVILNKDNAEGLKKCIESLVNQTAKICEDFDVLILDGASSDSSENVVKSFLEYPCISFKIQKKLGGTGFARVEACNYALSNGYEVVIWGDSENVYFNDYVDKMLRSLGTADVVGGLPVISGGFYAHAFAWYHAIHAIIPRLARRHIPGNNRGERVEIFKKVMYPESKRAEDYGFSLALMKSGVKLKQKLVDARVRVSLPNKLGDIHKWQMARAKGAAEAALQAGVFPYDSIIWLTALSPVILAPVSSLASLFLLLMIFFVSIVIFIKSLRYIEKPKKRFFFAPFCGIIIYSTYTLISLLYYLRLKIF